MTITNYFWDPLQDNVVKEYDDNGDTIVRYATEPDLYGNLISQERDGVASYYHFDGQGNTLALTDDVGDHTDEYDYNGFGSPTKSIGVTENTRSWGAENGCSFDSNLFRYDIRPRVYDPAIGRWLSLDPLGVLDGNLFTYSHNNPTTLSDPSGLDPEAGPHGGTVVDFLNVANNNSIYLARDKTVGLSVTNGGDISGRIYLKANRDKVGFGDGSGFVPNQKGTNPSSSDPRFVGLWVVLEDSKAGEDCGPGNAGSRVWASASLLKAVYSRFSAKGKANDLGSNHAGASEYNHWYLDEYRGFNALTTIAARDTFPGLMGAYWDTPGLALPKDYIQSEHFTLWIKTGYSVAILCVCRKNDKLIVEEPLATFNYTLIREESIKTAAVSVKINNSFSGEPKNWLKLEYDPLQGGDGGWPKLTDAVPWK